ELFVRRTWFVPSAFMTYISRLPSRSLVNAILPLARSVAVWPVRASLRLPVYVQLGPTVCPQANLDEAEKLVVTIIKAVITRTRTVGRCVRIFILFMVTSYLINEVSYQGAPSTNARISRETSN